MPTMKSDLLSRGSLCLEASASEPAEAQVNMLWRLALCRKVTYSSFPHKAHFLSSWAVTYSGTFAFRLVSMSRARSFINLRKVFWNRNISVLTRALPVMESLWGGFVFSPEWRTFLENYERSSTRVVKKLIRQ